MAYYKKKEYTPAETAEYAEKKSKEKNDLEQMVLDIVHGYQTNPLELIELACFSAQFHQYSIRNMMLIYHQMPQASFVGGFNMFNEIGRKYAVENDKKQENGKYEYFGVKSGSSSLKILCPVDIIQIKDENGNWIKKSEAPKALINAANKGNAETRNIKAYKVGSVFDISQTLLPKEYYPKIIQNLWGSSSEEHKMVADAITSYCKTFLNINVEDMMYGITLSGTAREKVDGEHIIGLNEKLDDTRRLSTLAHEIGHIQLNHFEMNGKKTNSEREVEADIFSMFILSNFGFEIDEARKKHFIDNFENSFNSTEETNKFSEVLQSVWNKFKTFVDDLEPYVNSFISLKASSSEDLSVVGFKNVDGKTSIEYVNAITGDVLTAEIMAEMDEVYFKVSSDEKCKLVGNDLKAYNDYIKASSLFAAEVAETGKSNKAVGFYALDGETVYCYDDFGTSKNTSMTEESLLNTTYCNYIKADSVETLNAYADYMNYYSMTDKERIIARTLPYVRIIWSESNKLESGIYSLSYIEDKLKQLDNENSATIGYDKTKLQIVYGDYEHYQMRYDIGSENGKGIIGHIADWERYLQTTNELDVEDKKEFDELILNLLNSYDLQKANECLSTISDDIPEEKALMANSKAAALNDLVDERNLFYKEHEFVADIPYEMPTAEQISVCVEELESNYDVTSCNGKNYYLLESFNIGSDKYSICCNPSIKDMPFCIASQYCNDSVYYNYSASMNEFKSVISSLELNKQGVAEYDGNDYLIPTIKKCLNAERISGLYERYSLDSINFRGKYNGYTILVMDDTEDATKAENKLKANGRLYDKSEKDGKHAFKIYCYDEADALNIGQDFSNKEKNTRLKR